MNVIAELPPNYDKITAVFGPLGPNVVFAYGDRVYSPSGTDLPPDLVAHEQRHLEQQAIAGGPESWWHHYLVEPSFRLQQEVEAYRAQLASFPNRQQRRARLKQFARDLSSSMYGSIVSFEEARSLLVQP